MSGPTRDAATTIGHSAGHDGRLIERSWSEPELFAAIFDRYYNEIHRYADRRLGADTADDVAADTFCVAFRKRTGFDTDRESARPWLYGIATRLISRHRRNEVRRLKALATAPADRPTPGHDELVADQVSAGARTAEVTRALVRLTSGERDVLLLVALGDLSYEEVAKALGVAYGTVCSRLNRARTKLRTELGTADKETHHG